MQENGFDQPSPQTRSGHDFSANPLYGRPELIYKAGQIESASIKMYMDKVLPPEYLTQGFYYYDRDAKQRVKVEKFTAYLIGIYVAAFSDGKEKGDNNYLSNLVRDTRSEVFECFTFQNGKREVFASGIYASDIKPAFERIGRNSPYTRVAVAYSPDFNGIISIRLSATAAAGVAEMIGAARGISPVAVNFLGMGEYREDGDIWVLQYSGDANPVEFTRDNKTTLTAPANRESKKAFFQPVFTGGAWRHNNETHATTISRLKEMQREFAAYLDSEQSFLKSKGLGLLGQPSAQMPNDAVIAPPLHEPKNEAYDLNAAFDVPSKNVGQKSQIPPIAGFGDNIPF